MDAGSSLCAVLLFAWFSSFAAEQKTITVESGQNVTLTCRAPDDKNDLVEWTRPDLTKPVLVYRDGKSILDEQLPYFKDRAALQDKQMKDGDVSLILKNVTDADNGTYKCHVQRDGDSSMQLISIITLSVVAPPGPTQGTTADGAPVGLIVGLSVAAVLLVAAVGGFLYRRHKQKQGSYHRPAE